MEKIKNKQELLKRVASGEVFEYQGFLNGVLSNWHSCQFTGPDGKKYTSTEHYFMAEKAKFFADARTYDKIMLAGKGRDARRVKELGREVNPFDEQAWMIESPRIMLEANLLKYDQNSNLKKVLLETEDKILVECNDADLIWGAGIHMQDSRLTDPFDWPGEDKLGFILMAVRNRLRELDSK